MAAIYVSNLIINAGSDFSHTFVLEGSVSNAGLDLTEYTVFAQMRKWYGSSNFIDFNTEIIFPESGSIMISLSSEQTVDIKPGRYVYDVIVVDSFGIKSRVVEGTVLVREGVTR